MWPVLLVALVALQAAPARTEELIFNEDFNSLNESRWQHLVTAWRGGNWEFQYYRNNRKNSYVKDGKLYIKPTLTADEYGNDFVYHGKLSYPDCNMQPCSIQAGDEIVSPVLSARLSTHTKFSFKYGRLEIRARLPKGDWIWPAIWLMPEKDVFGSWPRSGEIDLVESRGNRHLRDGGGHEAGIRAFGSTLHFGPSWDHDRWDKAHYSKSYSSETLGDDFHVYALDWSENGMRFLVDNQVIGDLKAPNEGFWKYGGFSGKDIWSGQRMAPFNQEFYIILNVAVGGAFFSDDQRNEPYQRPWQLSSGHAMRQFWDNNHLWKGTWQGDTAALQVDYIRVYKH